MGTITIKDVAKLCGVGVSTVSRAINDHPDINPETKQMIMKVIEENNYIPNNSARNLKRSDSKTIAVLVKGVDNPFFGKMIRVIEEEIRKKKYSMVVHHVEAQEGEVAAALELERQKKLCGMIFLGGFYSETSEDLAKVKVPVVLVTSAKPQLEANAGYSSVSVDDVKESYRMVDYLCELGHERIAILTATMYDESVGKLRLQGYKKALQKHNIEINENLIKYMKDSEDYSMKCGYILMKELLESKEEISSVFAISDSLAIGACRAIHEAGLGVPEDIAVAGFDGLDIGAYYTPTLTTIVQPVEEIAKEAAKILFHVIKKKTIHTHKFFEGELVVRESTNEKDSAH
ncbi:MAG: LacI family transcriptional regulator [Lachnospiraceae bacterium]|nr:LacI family transcriptional regulator [Lachnospiraceae bacterium]